MNNDKLITLLGTASKTALAVAFAIQANPTILNGIVSDASAHKIAAIAAAVWYVSGVVKDRLTKGV